MVKIYGRVIEDSTVDIVFDLSKRRYIGDIIAFPNANVMPSGLLTGVVVDVEGGVLTSMVSEDINSKVIIERFKTDSSIDTTMLPMTLPNLLTRNTDMIEVGIDGHGFTYVVRKMSGDRLIDKTGHIVYHKTKRFKKLFTKNNYSTDGIATKIFNNITEYSKNEINLVELVEKEGGIVEHRIRVGKNGYTLGNGYVSLVLLRGQGYHPTTCGKHLNKVSSKVTLNKQTITNELKGVVNNLSQHESPSTHRNPLMLYSDLKVAVENVVKTVVSIKA